MKWALISFPKPLCFILLLPLSIFPVCGSVLCTCAQAHTRAHNTHTDTWRPPARSIISVHKQTYTLCGPSILASCSFGQVREAVCVAWSAVFRATSNHQPRTHHSHISAPPYSTHPHPTSPRHTPTYSETKFIY